MHTRSVTGSARNPTASPTAPLPEPFPRSAAVALMTLLVARHVHDRIVHVGGRQRSGQTPFERRHPLLQVLATLFLVVARRCRWCPSVFFDRCSSHRVRRSLPGSCGERRLSRIGLCRDGRAERPGIGPGVSPGVSLGIGSEAAPGVDFRVRVASAADGRIRSRIWGACADAGPCLAVRRGLIERLHRHRVNLFVGCAVGGWCRREGQSTVRFAPSVQFACSDRRSRCCNGDEHNGHDDSRKRCRQVSGRRTELAGHGPRTACDDRLGMRFHRRFATRVDIPHRLQGQCR